MYKNNPVSLSYGVNGTLACYKQSKVNEFFLYIYSVEHILIITRFQVSVTQSLANKNQVRVVDVVSLRQVAD